MRRGTDEREADEGGRSRAVWTGEMQSLLAGVPTVPSAPFPFQNRSQVVRLADGLLHLSPCFDTFDNISMFTFPRGKYEKEEAW